MYNQDDCCVCLELLQENKISTASCGHIFHSKCMREFLKIDDRCPLCRQTIYNDEIRINRNKRTRYSFSIEDELI